MISWLHIGWGGGRQGDLRLRMIHETEAFLSWALAKDRGLPRIPCRRVDDGGFSHLLHQPALRKVAWRWWDRALDTAWPDRW